MFHFNDHIVNAEINGKEYPINISSSELQDEVAEERKKLIDLSQSINTNEPGSFTKLSEIQQNISKIILGEDAFNEIYANRIPDFIEDARLMTYCLKLFTEESSKFDVSDLYNEFGLKADD